MTEHDWLIVFLAGGLVTVVYAAGHDYGTPDARRFCALMVWLGIAVTAVGFAGVALT